MGRANLVKVYPELRFGGFTRKNLTVLFLARAQALAMGSKTVLDIGCGRGQYMDDQCEYRRTLRDFRATGRHVIGIDVDPAGHSNPLINEFRQIGKDFRWPVDDASIDFAMCDYVLEHVPDPDAFFGELRRVLRPGGVFITRTPSRWSYIAVAARLIPNSMHAKVVGKVQEGRKEMDVFPTVYRANTRGALRKQLRRQGFEECVYSVEGDPNYMHFSHVLYRVMDMIHAVLPPFCRSTIIAMARKPK